MRQSAKLATLVFVFIASLRPPLDLDLGWHLRYGEYFFKTGQVLKDNVLSVVWPNFHWVQASWGYDLIVYQLFTRFGFPGLSISAALISVIIFSLLTRPLKRFSPSIFLLLAIIFLTQTAPLFGTGLRAQTLSALLFAICLFLIHSHRYWFLPIVFLFWANLHGGFFLGLIITTIFILGRKFKLKSVLSLAAAWLAPLINPWGPRLYQEIFTHSINTNLTIITEWMPLPLKSVEAVIFFFVTLLVLFATWLRRKSGHLPYMIAFLFVTYLSFTATRFLIMFGIMATYFLARHLPKNLPAPYSLLTLLTLITLVSFDTFFSHRYFILPSTDMLTFSWADYCHPLVSPNGSLTKDCSEEITQIMLQNPPPKAGFHPYNYGGYLSWRIPQVKTFIDGRMTAWQDSGNTPPVVAGDHIFLDKSPLTWRKFDNDYHFNWAIVPTHTPIVTYLDDLVKSRLWEKPYQDQFFSYYVKNF